MKIVLMTELQLWPLANMKQTDEQKRQCAFESNAWAGVPATAPDVGLTSCQLIAVMNVTRSYVIAQEVNADIISSNGPVGASSNVDDLE